MRVEPSAESARGEQTEGTDFPVHRRADLVTHVREERRFRLVCRLCALDRGLGARHRARSFGDVLLALGLQEQLALTADHQAVEEEAGDVRSQDMHRHAIEEHAFAASQIADDDRQDQVVGPEAERVAALQPA